MPKGTPLYKILTKDEFLRLYQINGSINGVSKETGFDPSSLRNLMKRYNIKLVYKTKYTHNDFAFSKETPQSYYWAGFLAADGCIKERNKNTKIIALSLANKDFDHIEKFKSFCEAQEPIKQYDNYSSIHITSKQMANDLEKFNIVPRKTKIYKFPNINNNLEKHFMRGYFDGDGGISINKNLQASISIRGTKKFLEKYRESLVKNSNVNNVKIRLSSGIYIMQYCGNGNARKIFSWLYDGDDYLIRKYKIIKNFIS